MASGGDISSLSVPSLSLMKKKTWTTTNFKSVVSQGRYWNTTRNEWIFRWAIHIFRVKLWQTAFSSPSPLACVLRKPGSAFEPLSISYWSSLASWTQWLKLFFSVIYTMAGTKPEGPLRSMWLWKNKDKTICGTIEMNERLLQLRVNPTAVQAIEPPF